jgi:hypothetical protein
LSPAPADITVGASGGEAALRTMLVLLALIGFAAAGYAQAGAPAGLAQARRVCPITGCPHHCPTGSWDCHGKCIPKRQVCPVFSPNH